MVGHTGDLEAAIIAAETVDLCIGRLMKHLESVNAVTIITADHGNLEEMYEIDKKTGKPQIDAAGIKKPKTSHTLNPVPVIICNHNFHNEYRLSDVKNPGLANIASTILLFLGYNPPEDYMPPLIEFN
jgi:2,3-bisphosphoglycerate-independent phosphoglycerate mutase